VTIHRKVIDDEKSLPMSSENGLKVSPGKIASASATGDIFELDNKVELQYLNNTFKEMFSSYIEKLKI